MAKIASRKSLLGISRIDHEGSRTFGFFVRIGYRRTKRGSRPRFTAFFGDISHGGKRAALQAAVTYRDKTLRALRAEERDRRAPRSRRKKVVARIRIPAKRKRARRRLARAA
jgi:hypothetical protein